MIRLVLAKREDSFPFSRDDGQHVETGVVQVGGRDGEPACDKLSLHLPRCCLLTGFAVGQAERKGSPPAGSEGSPVHLLLHCVLKEFVFSGLGNYLLQFLSFFNIYTYFFSC